MSDLLPDPIETDRLVLAALDADAADPLTYHEHASGEDAEDVTAHRPWDPHDHRRDSLDDLREAEAAREAGEHARCVIRPRESEDGGGEFAGTTGVYPKWDRRRATFGVRLRPAFRGRGCSGERAAATVELALDRLDLDAVAVARVDGDETSRRAVEKYVERFGGRHGDPLRNLQVDEDGGVVDERRYTMTRDRCDVDERRYTMARDRCDVARSEGGA
jgi:RimJ/RimL family protein N-acetyltransferase